MTKPKKTKDSKEIQQCGFCGRYFVGSEYLTAEQLKKFNLKKLEKAPLGYCPDAEVEDYQQNPENYRHQVTRDMATDAGDLSLEGQWI